MGNSNPLSEGAGVRLGAPGSRGMWIVGNSDMFGDLFRDAAKWRSKVHPSCFSARSTTPPCVTVHQANEAMKILGSNECLMGGSI